MSLVIVIRWSSKNGFCLLWKIGIFTDRYFKLMCFGIGRESKIDEEFYNKILHLKCHLFLSRYLECTNTEIPGYILFQKCYVFFHFIKIFKFYKSEGLTISHYFQFWIVNIHEIFHPWITKRTLKYKIPFLIMWLSTNFFMPYLASRGDEITIVNTRQQKRRKQQSCIISSRKNLFNNSWMVLEHDIFLPLRKPPIFFLLQQQQTKQEFLIF